MKLNNIIQVSFKDIIDKMITIMEKLYEAAAATLLPSLPDLIFVLRCLVTSAVLFTSFVITRWLFRIVRLFAGMFEPMNYELVSATEFELHLLTPRALEIRLTFSLP